MILAAAEGGKNNDLGMGVVADHHVEKLGIFFHTKLGGGASVVRSVVDHDKIRGCVRNGGIFEVEGVSLGSRRNACYARLGCTNGTVAHYNGAQVERFGGFPSIGGANVILIAAVLFANVCDHGIVDFVNVVIDQNTFCDRVSHKFNDGTGILPDGKRLFGNRRAVRRIYSRLFCDDSFLRSADKGTSVL